MKTILLTGCAGFIGARTSEFLLQDGVKVVGVDNLNDYYDIRLKTHRLDAMKTYDIFSFFNADIEEISCLEPLFRRYEFDAVINLAARAGVRYSIENPHVYFTTNANGTLNLLELMKKYGVEKMVLASTSSLYAGQKMPFSEDLPVNTPISSYAASKKAAEVVAYAYHYLFGLDISIVRYFTVYGPAGRPDMSIFRFIKWIDDGVPLELFGDGTQSRDFTYIDDIAKGTIKAVKKVGYEIINLGGGKRPVSLNKVISIIERYFSKKARIDYKPFHKADIKETWAEISKAESVLDWRPEVSLEDGLKASLDWYAENREWLKDIRL